MRRRATCRRGRGEIYAPLHRLRQSDSPASAASTSTQSRPLLPLSNDRNPIALRTLIFSTRLPVASSSSFLRPRHRHPPRHRHRHHDASPPLTHSFIPSFIRPFGISYHLEAGSRAGRGHVCKGITALAAAIARGNRPTRALERKRKPRAHFSSDSACPAAGPCGRGDGCLSDLDHDLHRI